MDSVVKFNDDVKMTIKEVSEVLKKEESTIRKIGKKLFPANFKNGIKTYLNEKQVTLIKLNLGKNSELPKTQLEKELIIQQAIGFQQEKIQSLELELLLQKPKVELADKALRNDNHMSIRDAGKHLGLRQKDIFQIMRDNKYLTSKNLPTQKALDRDILQLHTNADRGFKQSVMTMENIMNFSIRHLQPKGFATGGLVLPTDKNVIVNV